MEVCLQAMIATVLLGRAKLTNSWPDHGHASKFHVDCVKGEGGAQDQELKSMAVACPTPTS